MSWGMFEMKPDPVLLFLEIVEENVVQRSGINSHLWMREMTQTGTENIYP